MKFKPGDIATWKMSTSSLKIEILEFLPDTSEYRVGWLYTGEFRSFSDEQPMSLVDSYCDLDIESMKKRTVANEVKEWLA